MKIERDTPSFNIEEKKVKSDSDRILRWKGDGKWGIIYIRFLHFSHFSSEDEKFSFSSEKKTGIRVIIVAAFTICWLLTVCAWLAALSYILYIIIDKVSSIIPVLQIMEINSKLFSNFWLQRSWAFYYLILPQRFWMRWIWGFE